MNERIEKLALQARECADELLGSGLPDTVWQDRYHEKFAELLAQDAISIVQSFRWKMDASNDNIVVSLKQHFGVE